MWRLLGTKLRMFSAHHPQTDGQTEAANRVVEMTLRCTLHNSGEPVQWARELPLIEFIINNSPSQSIGYTPFYLNYGYHPANPLDLLRDSRMTTVEGVNVFMQRLEKISKKASQMLQRAQERQKIQADKRRRE